MNSVFVTLNMLAVLSLHSLRAGNLSVAFTSVFSGPSIMPSAQQALIKCICSMVKLTLVIIFHSSHFRVLIPSAFDCLL